MQNFGDRGSDCPRASAAPRGFLDAPRPGDKVGRGVFWLFGWAADHRGSVVDIEIERFAAALRRVVDGAL